MSIIERNNIIEPAGPHAEYAKAGAPSDGDFDGVAEKGSRLVDTTNGKLYINTGTKADTTWTLVGAQTP